jgi:hypothetical protein
MRWSRRAVVTALAGFGGGCLGSRRATTPTPGPDTDGDGVPDEVDEYPTDARRASRNFRAEGTQTLQPGEFSAVALTNSPRASGTVLQYDIAVEGDAAVDCLVFEREAYDAYEDGARDVSFVSEYSRIGVTETSLIRTLDRGEYVFSLDFTEQATPPGDERVTVTRLLELGEPAGG